MTIKVFLHVKFNESERFQSTFSNSKILLKFIVVLKLSVPFYILVVKEDLNFLVKLFRKKWLRSYK